MGEVQDVRDVKKPFVAPALKPFEHYDFSRAKICCNLSWLVSKAFETDSIPADLQEPFYTVQYEQEHLKPLLASLLLSADLYCRAGSLILKGDTSKPLLGHKAVIQALVQRGLYVIDQERLVSAQDLRTRPLQMSAHLAMIDTLMMAYIEETVSVDNVMSCICQYSQPDSEEEMPYDTEDTVKTWINKVNEYLKDILIQEQKMSETQNTDPVGAPRARCRKDQSHSQPIPWIPPVDNLLEDSADGSALAALLHFYCPQLLPLNDIRLKENMALADKIYNLQLIRDFCKNNLNSYCHFSLEDMLYASSTIKNNYLVFMAELFWWFEFVKPSSVQPRTLEHDGTVPSSLLKDVPVIPLSMATKRSFMERPPSSERPDLPLRPQPRNSGKIKRFISMSFVDGNLGTWPKEKQSGPYGVSYYIPLDKEDSAPAPHLVTQGLSVSTDDGSGFKVHSLPRGRKRNLTFQPVNRQSIDIEEEECCPDNLSREPGRPAFPDGHDSAKGKTPSMEDALQVIPNKPPVEGINRGFFLHSQDHRTVVGSLEPVSKSDSKNTDTAEVGTGIHNHRDNMLDEDSSLKDCSMKMDLDMDTPSPSPSNQSKCPSGRKMISLVEQKMKKVTPAPPDSGRGSISSIKTSPEGSTFWLPLSVSWAPTLEHNPVQQQTTPSPMAKTSPSPVQLPPNDPAQVMATEMVQLRIRLEDKRKAIEAQKKKEEAAFTRHCQKIGHSALLNVMKSKGDGAASFEEESRKTASPTFKLGRSKTDTSDEVEQISCWTKSPGAGEEGVQSHPQITEIDVSEYTRSIEKLSHSLAFLQSEVQRLSQQQEIIMAMLGQQQAWVIPHRSPTSIKRKSTSFYSKNPCTARPNELKLAPDNRVLTAPQSVDTNPKLRHISPCLPSASSFVYMEEKPLSANAKTTEKTKEMESLLTCGKVHSGRSAAKSLPTSPNKMNIRELDLMHETIKHTSSSVLSHPVIEGFTMSLAKLDPELDASAQGKSNLIEVPLSIVKSLEDLALEEALDLQLGIGDSVDADQKTSLGFFFKEDGKAEKNMAQKRAALLDKRMKVEKERQQRKIQLEALASLNQLDSDSEKRVPRPDAGDGFLSPSRSSSRNGERDWENASTTSSVTSNTECTGPRLYKEPSAKSNKQNIQNALAHCCLAGKANEAQKKKILKEMEKSASNNFLVLFRDAGCQFRSLYTYCPETEEMNKLAGTGPKSVTRKMIHGLFKYNSYKKQFSQIPAKTLSASVDAVTIHGHLWQTKKPRKVVPPQS